MAPCEVRILYCLLLKNDLLSSPGCPLLWARRAERECGIVDQCRSTNRCAETLSVGSCVPEFAELTRVLVVRKGHKTVEKLFFTPHGRQNVLVSY